MLSPEELDDVLRVQATGNLRYVYIISSDISAQIKEKLRSLNPDIQFVFLTKSNAIEKLPIIYDRIR